MILLNESLGIVEYIQLVDGKMTKKRTLKTTNEYHVLENKILCCRK